MKRSTLTLILVALMTSDLSSATPKIDAQEFQSARLCALAAALNESNEQQSHQLVESFWNERQGKGPLIEPIDNDPAASWVTFLWRGNASTRTVGVLGTPPTQDVIPRLERLAGTDIWFRTDRIPNDTRTEYRFMVNLPEKMPLSIPKRDAIWKEIKQRPDPLNPHHDPTHEGSMLEMPDAPPQPWLQRVAGVPNYIVSDIEKALINREVRECTFESGVLKKKQTYSIYTPPKYDRNGEPCNLLVLFDGNGATQMKNNPFPISAMLDYLINEKKIPPTVGVFVYQTDDRSKELGCSESFADFVAKELIPHVRTEYRTTDDPSRTTIGGMSLGGLMATFCAMRHSDVFGNVLSMSGSFQWFPGAFDENPPPDAEPAWLVRKFVDSPRLPVRFYLCAGKFENFYPFSLLAANRHFRDVLRAKGYPVHYSEFSGGHNPVCWCGPFVEGMTVLAAMRK